MVYPAGTSATWRMTFAAAARTARAGDALGDGAGAAQARSATRNSAAQDLTWSRYGAARRTMQNRTMRRIGHRGAMGHAPENTITSFKKALDLLCDEVETDVWLTQDGRMLVSHDRPTAKTTLSLDEVLDFCRGRLAVNVELKCEKDETRARETGASVATRLAARRLSAARSSTASRPTAPRCSRAQRRSRCGRCTRTARTSHKSSSVRRTRR